MLHGWLHSSYFAVRNTNDLSELHHGRQSIRIRLLTCSGMTRFAITSPTSELSDILLIEALKPNTAFVSLAVCVHGSKAYPT
jgi:hypothetical protein